MPRGKVKWKQGREHLREPPPPRTPPFYNVHTARVEAEHVVIQRNQAHIMSMLAGLASDMSEMKRSLITTEIQKLPTDDAPPVDSLTTCKRLDTKLEAEQHNQAQILSVLTGLVSDMSKMKRLITEPPKIKILPIDIQEEIMKKLPVKSLVRFRCVSKSWKSLIDSSKFIGEHTNQPQHLFVWYKVRRQGDKHVSFADNDSFPHRRFVPILPISLRLLTIIGSSYGLLCLDGVGNHPGHENYGKRMAVIWNPSLGKSIAVDVPKVIDEGGDIVLGFGVCPLTIDPKIVHITQLRQQFGTRRKIVSKQFGNFWKVGVYKLSSGIFRNLSSSNLPSVSVRIRIMSTQVVIDRFIYWCGEVDCEPVVDDGALQTRNLIMSFDITEENFKVVDLPDCLATLHTRQLSISKLRESLVMLAYNEEHDAVAVWKMDHGLFTKLFSINACCESIRALGFRKSGGPVMAVEDCTVGPSPALVVYEPMAQPCNDLILGDTESFLVESYMETLLLIDRSL